MKHVGRAAGQPVEPRRAIDTVRAACVTPRRTGIGRVALLLVALMLLGVAGRSHAVCWGNQGSGAVAFTPPATITLPGNLPPGTQTILWTSPPITPSPVISMTCFGNTNSGIVNSIASQPVGDDTLFPTNITNLSYRLLHPDASTLLRAYPNYPVGSGQFSVATALQLVATGPIANGATFFAGPLAQWQVDTFGGPTQVEIFQTNSTLTFIAPACTVAVDPTVVTLPTVYSSAFAGVGTPLGPTSFSVQLNCPSTAAGASLSITLAANNPVAGATGVIANTTGSGYAQNVGVQVLDGNGHPVSFGTAIPAGTVTAGNFNIQLNARYYQTGASVTAGQVKATATYTITYQ